MKRLKAYVFSIILIAAVSFAAGCAGQTEWQPDTDRPWNFAPVVNEDDAEG